MSRALWTDLRYKRAGLAWLAGPSLRSGSLRLRPPGARFKGGVGDRYLLLQMGRILDKTLDQVNGIENQSYFCNVDDSSVWRLQNIPAWASCCPSGPWSAGSEARSGGGGGTRCFAVGRGGKGSRLPPLLWLLVCRWVRGFRRYRGSLRWRTCRSGGRRERAGAVLGGLRSAEDGGADASLRVVTSRRRGPCTDSLHR